MSNQKGKRYADKRIEELTNMIETFLERTRQLEVEAVRKKRGVAC